MGQDPDAIRREIEETRERMGETVEALGYKADVPARSKEAVTEKVEGVKETVSDKVQGVKESILGAKDTVTDKLPVGGGSSEGPGVTDRAQGALDSVTGRVQGVAGTVSDKTPSTDQVKAKARRGVSVAQQNPLGLAFGSLALGFLAGMLIPETKKEHETLGPVADQVKEQVRSTGQEALERGKQVAQQVAETAQDAGQQVAAQVKETTQQAAQDVKQTAQESAQQQGQGLQQSAQQNAQQAAQQAREQVRS
jgi:gas vesicle protein